MPFLSQTPRIYYRRWTSEAPRAALLLLHGFSEHSGLYHRLAAELTRSGVEVWALDHVGHGLSDARDRMFASVEQLAANACALLDQIRREVPTLPLFVLGHSLGGLTAISVAAERPGDLSGLVLSGPPVLGLPANLPSELIFSREPSYLDEIAHDPLGGAPPATIDNLWRAVGEFVPHMPPLVERIAAPTLVVFGEHDVFTPPALVRTWIDGLADVYPWIVPDAYHDVLQDRMHRQVARRICGFIEGHRAISPRDRSDPD